MLLSTGKKNLKEAEDATAPKADEIDTRYREQAGIRTRAPPLGCGSRTNWPATAPWRTTWRGQPASLSSGVDWRLRRRDQPEGTAEEPLDCDLLILPVDAKSAPSASEMKRLTAYLDGGVLG